MAAPTDQRALVRPISFLLDTGLGSISAPVTLKIRPEDLVRSESSRITVNQTLGRTTQGWADNFGEGLPSVTISGHTGWRPSGYDAMDGVAAFEQLNTLVMKSYHAYKQVAIDQGNDPGNVKLLFVDMLDNFAWSVAPIVFVLRRNKQRPLLMQYNIVLQALATEVDTPSQSPLPTASVTAGLDSLINSVNNITSFIKSVSTFIDRNLVAPVRDFMQKTAKLYSAVVTAIRAGAGIADQLIGVARMVTQSALNIFRTFTAVASIPSIVKSKLMQVATEYSNIFCLLNNAFRRKGTYNDYNDFYGSSNCSSTAGGRPISPLSGTNPFYALFPQQPGLPIQLTQPAQNAVMASASSDVVLNPMSTAMVGNYVQTISSGMTVV